MVWEHLIPQKSVEQVSAYMGVLWKPLYEWESRIKIYADVFYYISDVLFEVIKCECLIMDLHMYVLLCLCVKASVV